MVLCELIGDEKEQKEQTKKPQLVELLRVSSGLLYCNQKFYVIDPSMQNFERSGFAR
jgi:hypothetical protein